jgi:hypothetical protein
MRMRMGWCRKGLQGEAALAACCVTQTGSSLFPAGFVCWTVGQRRPGRKKKRGALLYLEANFQALSERRKYANVAWTIVMRFDVMYLSMGGTYTHATYKPPTVPFAHNCTGQGPPSVP